MRFSIRQQPGVLLYFLFRPRWSRSTSCCLEMYHWSLVFIWQARNPTHNRYFSSPPNGCLLTTQRTKVVSYLNHSQTIVFEPSQVNDSEKLSLLAWTFTYHPSLSYIKTNILLSSEDSFHTKETIIFPSECCFVYPTRLFVVQRNSVNECQRCWKGISKSKVTQIFDQISNQLTKYKTISLHNSWSIYECMYICVDYFKQKNCKMIVRWQAI